MQNEKIEYIPCQDEYRKVMLMEQDDGSFLVTVPVAQANTLPEAQKLAETATTTMLELVAHQILV